MRKRGQTIPDGKFPAGRFAIGANLREAKPVVQVTDHSVLGGRYERAEQAIAFFRAAQFDKFIADELLDAPLQDAAAHDPRIDHEVVALWEKNHG